MKRYRVIINREFPASNDLSVSQMILILEDVNGDSEIELWADTFISNTLPGYAIDEICELA